MPWWTLTDARGLNQRAQPLMGSDEGIVLEAENTGFFQQGALVQRFSASDQSLSGSGFTGIVEWLARHVTNAGVSETWAAANNSGTAALAHKDTSTWTPVSFSDTVNVSNLRYMTADSLNGKFFINYDSDVNRAHCWTSTTLRRVGFATSTAPTVAQLGIGAISATRYYRQRYIELSGTTVVRRSEASSSVTLAIVNRAGWQVTKGATITEGETHWEVEAAAAADGPWYRIATVVVGTTTYDDTSSTIDDENLSADAGAYLPPPSAKYVLSTGDRILYAGAWETASSAGQTEPKQNRVWFTPALGATGEGDDERIPDTDEQSNWIDVGDPGPVTGLAGPLYGDIYVFKLDSVWKLVATGDVDNPYRRVLVSGAIGAVDQRVIVPAETGQGVPAIYFASLTAIYGLSQNGVQDISEKISRDLRLNNFSSTESLLDFDPLGKCLWAQTNAGTSGGTGQYFQFQYDLVRGNWAGVSIGGGESAWVVGRSLLGIDTVLGGGGATVRASCVSLSENGVARLLLGGSDPSSASWITAWGDKCAADGSTPFTVRQRIRKIAKPGWKFKAGNATILYRSPSGSTTTTGTLQLTYIRHDGEMQSQTITVDATPQDDPLEQKEAIFDALQMDNCTSIDVRSIWSYTAGFESTNPPSIDAIMIWLEESEQLAA